MSTKTETIETHETIDAGETVPETATETVLDANQTADEVTDNELAKVRQEAKKYRHRAKEAETEAARLAGVVSALQQTEIARLLPVYVSPQLFSKLGPDPAELSTETGAIDPTKVDAAARDLMKEYGLGPKNTLPSWAHGKQPMDAPRSVHGMFDEGIRKETGQRPV